MNEHENLRPSALVTGASRGIGYELARRFARQGSDVPICAEDEEVTHVARSLREYGTRVEAVRADLGHRAGAEQLMGALAGMCDTKVGGPHGRRAVTEGPAASGTRSP